MNAVEIEEAISELANATFDPVEFPFQFLSAFGNKPPTIKRLRTGNTNPSDLSGAILQRCSCAHCNGRALLKMNLAEG